MDLHSNRSDPLDFKFWVMTITLALCIFPFPFTTRADVYRWVDDKGILHYSNDPPPHDAVDIQKYPELSSEGQGVIPEAETAPKHVEEDKTAEKKVESAAPPDSETMTRLKKNLKVRTSSHQQRKFKRRIKAQEIQEGIEPDQHEQNQ